MSNHCVTRLQLWDGLPMPAYVERCHKRLIATHALRIVISGHGHHRCPARAARDRVSVLARIKEIQQMTLLSATLELGGDWGASTLEDALVVLTRTREVCLTGLRLL